MGRWPDGVMEYWSIASEVPSLQYSDTPLSRVNLPVRQFHHPLRMRRNIRVVRGNDQRGLFFDAEILEQLDDFTTGVRIEIAGRFIGQEQFRLVDERAGDGHALLFAAGKFGRPVLHTVLETNPGEQVASARPGLADGSAGHARRQTDIFERIEFRQQMIRLKNETDAVVAEKRQLTLGECGQVLPGKMDFARVGRVKSADEMEQRAFAGTGRAAQGQRSEEHTSE